jgi:spermidine synthase
MGLETSTVARPKGIPALSGPAALGPTFGVYVIFTLSGSAALVYQIIWARWLTLVFGSTTCSISVVLGSFMLGLALGSWVVGRRLGRIRNPMSVYAWLELGIGAFALCFPFLAHLTDRLFGLLVDVETSFSISLAVRAALAFSLLVLPTTCMGATLPLLTDFFRRSPRRTRNWRVGLLYAANTAGAAIGAIVTSFLLIEWVGVHNTTLIAAGINFAIALWGFGLARSTSLLPADPPDRAAPSLTPPGTLAVAVLAASGALAMASEVLWTRTLEILVGNSTYAFALILVVYLAGLAYGSWGMSLLVKRVQGLPIWLCSTQVLMGIWVVCAISLFDVMSGAVAKYSLKAIPMGQVLVNYLMGAGILFPLAVFSGAAFPIATRILDPESEHATGSLIARAYAWNTMGAVLGSLFAGFWIAPHFDYIHSLYLLYVLYVGTGLVAFIGAIRCETCTPARVAGFAIAALSIVLMVYGAPRVRGGSIFKRRVQQRMPGMEVLYHAPGLQGVTTALRRYVDGRFRTALLINGTGMTRKVTDTKMMAHLPMLIHRDPRRTLVIGFGMGTTYRSAITYGGDVTVVELVKEVYEALDAFYQDADLIRSYPRGRWIVNDGRNFLKLTREKFDVITIDPPPPIDGAGVNNLYSKEFLELALAHLKPGGIMAHWIPVPGTGAGVKDRASFFMLLRTFAEVFPHTMTWQGFRGIGVHVLGSREPMKIDMERLRQRLARPAIRRDLDEWDEVPVEFFQRYVEVQPTHLETSLTVSDDRPRLEFDLVRSWRRGVSKVYQPVVW